MVYIECEIIIVSCRAILHGQLRFCVRSMLVGVCSKDPALAAEQTCDLNVGSKLVSGPTERSIKIMRIVSPLKLTGFSILQQNAYSLLT